MVSWKANTQDSLHPLVLPSHIHLFIKSISVLQIFPTHPLYCTPHTATPRFRALSLRNHQSLLTGVTVFILSPGPQHPRALSTLLSESCFLETNQITYSYIYSIPLSLSCNRHFSCRVLSRQMQPHLVTEFSQLPIVIRALDQEHPRVLYFAHARVMGMPVPYF